MDATPRSADGAGAAGDRSSEQPLRVGVVGARKALQGIGAFVARGFARAGCEVVAIVGTSEASVAAAAADLRRDWGLQPATFTDTEQMLARSRLDVLAICSPAEHHRPALQLGLAARVHVLCEKPLWWEPGTLAGGEVGARRLVADVTALSRGFATAGRLLALNTQWPFTLPAFRRLYPEALSGGLREFSMLLSPARTGPTMIVDAAPHALSLLQALVGPGRLESPRVRRPGGDDAALDVQFTYRPASPGPAGSAVAVELRLRHAPRQPRPAGYGLNGCWAERQVELPDYRMALHGAGRREPLDDPLDLLLADFVARARAGTRPDERTLVESLAHLRDLVAAAGAPESPP